MSLFDIKLLSLLLCSLSCISFVISAPRQGSEEILAQNLIGSHFGVPDIPASFSYIIVGGGTAGLTLARRLAANSSISVAVIEAGDFYEFSNGNLTEVPAYASFFVGSAPVAKNPLFDWYQYTQPQEVSH
jgi:hypothetical protein